MNDKESDANDMRVVLEEVRSSIKTVLVCAEMDMDGKTKCGYCRRLVENSRERLTDWLRMYDQLDVKEVNK